MAALFPGAGAAPHLPAGILSPYGDGERGALITGFANRQCRGKGAKAAAAPLLPVNIRGDGAGRRISGGANVENWRSSPSRAVLQTWPMP
ncbi:hypothetical protein CK219_07970 [Mesorhizobium sp. WSM4313]|nr:hypothetical protein CK219_07970 [Mesorhizobium sp. WSM4313]